MRMEITRASTLDEIIAEMDRRGRCLDRNAEYIERLKAVHRDAESEITRLRAANAELVAALSDWLDAVNDKRAFEHHQPHNIGKEWERLRMRCDIAEDAARAAIIKAKEVE